MSDWSLLGDGQRFEPLNVQLATSDYSGTTPHASNNTKGAWVQAIAATPFAGSGLMLTPGRSGVGDLLTDIAVGAPGAEQIIINNLLFSTPLTTMFRQLYSFILPLRIPAGSRLAMRSQASTAASTASLAIQLLVGGFLFPMPLSYVDTYGANTADSGGQMVDPGSTVNTKGAWVELSASCNRMRMMLIATGSRLNTTMGSAVWLMDIGVGAAGSEVVVIPNLMLASITGSGIYPKYIGPLPMHIPVGTRVAVRAQCDINDASDRLFDAVIYGMR